MSCRFSLFTFFRFTFFVSRQLWTWLTWCSNLMLRSWSGLLWWLTFSRLGDWLLFWRLLKGSWLLFYYLVSISLYLLFYILKIEHLFIFLILCRNILWVQELVCLYCRWWFTFILSGWSLRWPSWLCGFWTWTD